MAFRAGVALDHSGEQPCPCFPAGQRADVRGTTAKCASLVSSRASAQSAHAAIQISLVGIGRPCDPSPRRSWRPARSASRAAFWSWSSGRTAPSGRSRRRPSGRPGSTHAIVLHRESPEMVPNRTPMSRRTAMLPRGARSRRGAGSPRDRWAASGPGRRSPRKKRRPTATGNG